MKIINLKTVALFMLLSIAATTLSYAQGCCGGSNKSCSKKTTSTANANDTTNQTQKVYYSCSMHPEVKSDKPGNCSKCGIALDKKAEKIKNNPISEIENYYSCPMHPGVKQNKKGKCPKCGMNLKKQKDACCKN